MKKNKQQSVDFLSSLLMTDQASNTVSNFTEVANNVKTAVSEANKTIAEMMKQNGALDVPKLGGFYAEAHHAGTFNVNAALNKSTERAWTPHSNTEGSADIKTSWGEEYSSKYYKTAEASVKAQTERSASSEFKELKYDGQKRLIPEDQLNDAHKYVDKKIGKEELNRPDVAKDYKDTKDNLTDRVKSPEGNQSDPLDKRNAEEWAREAKKGNVKEFKNPDEVNLSSHIKEIGQAAASAAAISVAISSAPVVLGGFVKMYQDKDYDFSDYLSDLKDFVVHQAPRIAADSFAKAALAGSLTAACKSGALGESFKNISPAGVAAVSVIAIESAKAFYLWQKGELTGEQAASQAFKSGLQTCAGLGGKIIGQALIPIPFVGAVIGSMVASFLLNKGLDKIENPEAMKMLGLLLETFEAQKEILVNVFVSVVNYNDVYKSYCLMINSNQLIIVNQGNLLDSNNNLFNSNHRIGESKSEQIERGNEIVENLNKRNSLFN